MHYFVIYKPYGYLSQFTPEKDGDLTLKDLYPFPSDVYPVGRLDKDSEGLLLLTNDASMNHLILSPDKKWPKVYWVQLDGFITESAINKLSTSVSISIKGKIYNTEPCIVHSLIGEPKLPERIPSIRFRKSLPTSWIEITITEGKNRQIRKMCASVGFPVLRIVRVKIGNLKLDGMSPGEVITLENGFL
ncbi:MAG: pseudouridine synthase [Saprospiraceae bacterium]|nr:pseudouridine synthase [Candidatus Defluviibacterium haderslevense]MBK7244515.1 pseudouridine synthase [Candidatus Defluviibacterium haderslevense]